MATPESLQVTEADQPQVPNEPSARGTVSTTTATTSASSSLPSPAAARWWLASTLAFIAGLLFVRLSAFGVWDPWELRVADDARRLASEGHAAGEHIELGRYLVSLGFRWFGVHEWSGRLPIALCGVVCVWTTFQMAARFADTRGGVYAALIAGTTPLLLFNSRIMLGAAPDMAVSGLLGYAALSALLPDARAAKSTRLRGLGLLLSVLALTAVAVSTRGALLGVVPPLGAALVALWLAPAGKLRALMTTTTTMQRGFVALLALLLAICLALIARDVQRDATDFSIWLGGSASGINPPTFDAVLEQIFHAFAPWSALLPLALSLLWTPATDRQEPLARALQNACVVWVALAYGTQTLFASRYGHNASFLALAPLATLLALSLRELERDNVHTWAAGIGALLLCGLVLRDFALFPVSPVHSLALDNFEFPKGWNPRRSWSALLIPFGLCAAFGYAASSVSTASTLDVGAPYRFLGRQWHRGLAFKLWLIALLALVVGLFVFGVLAYAIPDRLHMPSLALKVVRKLVFTPLAPMLVALAFQLVTLIFARLGSYRFVPMLIAGASFGVYASQGFLPALSSHFSAREIYSAFNQLAGPQDTIAEYRVGTRAASYYASGKVLEVTSVAKLVDHLAAGGQRWAAFPQDDLAEIDHAFRTRTGEHLVIVDSRSAHAVLAATQPVAKHTDQNPLKDAIRKDVPATLQHAVSANFDDHLELLGFDWQLPHGSYVGAGESFTLTWYFRCVRKLGSPYRLFVHIDGQGQRIHGDHDPVDGKYAANLWEPGDIVADQQKIEVPASYRAGDYTIFMGFFSGDTRLPIKQGPNAGEDRARVGVLRIQ